MINKVELLESLKKLGFDVTDVKVHPLAHYSNFVEVIISGKASVALETGEDTLDDIVSELKRYESARASFARIDGCENRLNTVGEYVASALSRGENYKVLSPTTISCAIAYRSDDEYDVVAAAGCAMLRSFENADTVLAKELAKKRAIDKFASYAAYYIKLRDD